MLSYIPPSSSEDGSVDLSRILGKTSCLTFSENLQLKDLFMAYACE